MRHLKKGRKLNRTSAHRRAMLRNMAVSFIRHGTIRTTVPKAKELRVFVEPLITLAKEDNLAARRRAFSRLGNKAAVGKLFSTTAQICLARPGGYLSILKAGVRTGDKSPMALVRLMDAPDNYAELNYEAPAPAAAPAPKDKPAKDKAAKDKAKPAAAGAAGKTAGGDTAAAPPST